MATDYAEKEREFIAALADDTGKTLDEWMTAIGESGVTNRNDVIDWLRHRGFAFSRASWIERIHHNGGHPIYDGDATAAVEIAGGEPPRRAIFDEAPAQQPAELARSGALPDVAELLAAAKGLRPLAELVLRELVAVSPGVSLAPRAPLIVASKGGPFAALWPQPRLLRLYGDFELGGPLGVRPADAVNKAPAPFPRVMSLDDARRIDNVFRAALAHALERAEP